ncbi:PDxFFG protein [Mycoplasma simbae]|uniref:PDxFFG protein n=1 Tax=Mycoplasma simbae TaxID=36744 RepID=UPI000692072D|nr:PDxFFG protein [Mycoplasma simbae]
MENKQNQNPKKRFNWRTMVWPKYLISFGVVALAAATTIGIFKYNSNNPTLEKGTSAKYLKNEFLDPKATPKMSFVDSDKAHSIAEFDPTRGENGEVKFNDTWIDYDVFLKSYYEENKSLPFLNIRYGSFDFYNEYIEAVSAKDFFNFTQWFMQNVSWGPEIITLKEFSIVKGVELKGNNITLGSHSNQDKEYTTIKFFPDAFFGSIPLHSTLSGQGNASDSLLYRINKKLLTSKELNDFLDSIAIYNTFTNTSIDTLRSHAFRTLADKRSVIGKKVFAVKGELPQNIASDAYSLIEKTRLKINSDYISIINAENEAKAREKFEKYLAQYKGSDKSNSLQNHDSFVFEEKTIVDADFLQNQLALKEGAGDKYLKLIFEDGKSFVLFDAIDNAEYNKNDTFEKSENVESIEQGFDHSKRMFINLATDVASLYEKWIKDNVLFTEAKLEKFKKHIAVIDRLKEIEQEVIAQNTIIQNRGEKYNEAIRLYREDMGKSQAKVQQLNSQLASNAQEIKSKQAEIDAEQDADAKETKQYELFKLQQAKEAIELEIFEYQGAIVSAQKSIDEYTSKISTDEQVEAAGNKIKALHAEKTSLNEAKNHSDLLALLKSVNVASTQVDTIIGLYRLHNELGASKYNNFTEEFSTVQAKADYLLELRKYIVKTRPYYTWYNEILSGDNYAKLKPESDNIVLYSNDIAYLPTQLIALDELADLIKTTQINWREYANLDGFIRSQGDSASQEQKSFFVYAPNINKISEEFTAGDEALNAELKKVQNSVTELANSFNNDADLSQKAQAIEDKLAQAKLETLIEKYSKLTEELEKLGEKHQTNVNLLIRVATLKTFATAQNEESNEKLYYNDIKKLILQDSEISAEWDTFDAIMNDTDALSKQAQQEVNDYKYKVAKVIAEMYEIYSKVTEIYASIDTEFEQYRASKHALFDQKMIEIINVIKTADLTDPRYANDIQKLFEYSTKKIEEFNTDLAVDNKEVIEITTRLKDTLSYVKQLSSQYELDNLPELATAYFNVLKHRIYWEMDAQGNRENQGRKFIANLFNPIVSLRIQINEWNQDQASKYNDKAEDLLTEIAELGENAELVAKKQAELIEAKNYAKYYTELAETSFGNAEQFEKLANLEPLTQAFERDDFNEEDAYDVEDQNPQLAQQYSDQIAKFNSDLNRYIQISLRYEDHLKGFITRQKNETEILFANANKFKLVNDEYYSAFDEAKKYAEKIKNVDVLDKFVHKSINESEGKELNNTNQLIVATSKLALIEKLTKQGIIKTSDSAELVQFTKNNIFEMQLSNVSKTGTKLNFVLKEKSAAGTTIEKYKNTNYLKFFIDANIDRKSNPHALQQFKDMLDAAGYKTIIQPSAIKEEGSKIVTDENGKSKTITTYSLFVEAYDGFTDELLSKVPWAGEWLKGEHLVKKVNEKGEFEYKIEDGEYLGFRPDSRIGLWSLIMMSNPNYKGLSVDFLKFVAAHEYGHHITLNSAQDLGNKGQKPLFGSALVPGSTPNINNYYSREVLDLYLKARTHLGLNSSPLLNQPNVVSENNEGEYLLYDLARKVGDKIVIDKTTVENAADVWGHAVGDESLRKAMENSKRRFLQTYKGLVEATNERRKENGIDNEQDKKWLEVFDLWLMNTLDQNSGTLNPTKYSDEQYPVKYMVKDENGKYVFKKAALDMLQGVLKDGQGKFINFEQRDGHIVPIIVEGERDARGRFTRIDKVLVHNADGSPIINVPTGIDLSSNDLEVNPYYQEDDKHNNITIDYVNEKIQQAISTIRALIVEDYIINGWDFATTDTTLEPRTQIAYPNYSELFTDADKNYNKSILLPYIDYLQARDRSKGGVVGDNTLAKFYAINGEVIYDRLDKNKQPQGYRAIFQENYFVNPYEEKSEAQSTFTDVIIAMYLADGETYPTVPAGGKLSLWLSENEQYLPNIKLPESLRQSFLTDSFSPSILNQLRQRPLLAWYSEYMKKMVGHNIKDHIYLMVNASGQVVNQNPRSAQFPAFHEMKSIKINESLLPKDAENSLFNSFFVEQSGNRQFGFDIVFNDIKTFTKFASVDTLKAKLDPINRVVNWDLDYVSSKFDIDKFAKGLKSSLISATGISAKEKERLNALVAGNSRQALANEIMERFSSSKLAMFVKDLSLGTINEQIKANRENELRYGWIFDKDLGYGMFKSVDVKAVNNDQQIDKNNWEVSVKELLATFEKFAIDNNVSLDKLTIYDELIMDDKLQMYSTQLHYNFQQSRFGMADILLSFVKGFTKKSRPTEDVEQYFKTKTERKFNEFFSDYTYSFAEVINRDNLQITYSPSTSQFANLPSFISGVSEANTGLEYVIDGEPTARWNDAKINFTGEARSTVRNTIIDFERRLDNEKKFRADKLGSEFSPSTFSTNDGFSADNNKSSNYFGQFKSINNGWFKDRWYRDMLNFRLYDDEGQPVHDDTIRIKDLEGNVVTNRPQAYWQYYIQSQGVGKRNLTNIWRNTDKDAVALFGYLNNSDAQLANYLAFEDLQTGEIFTLKINKQNSSNMFYYKTQHINNETDPTSRHWLKDEPYNYTDSNGQHQGRGFTAWVSDYAIMSNYADRLLTPNHEYKIYFAADEKGKHALNVDLGTFESVSENSKTFSQAPTAVYMKEINGEKVAVMRVGVQFNGTK